MLGWQMLLAMICIVYDFVQSRSLNLQTNLFVWFLPVLFCSEIVFLLLSKIVAIDLKTCAVLTLISGVLQLLPLHTMVHIEIVPTAVLFLALGYSFKRYLMGDNQIKRIGIYSIAAIPVIVLFAEINHPVMMYNNDYGNFVLFMITAVVGSLETCMLGKLRQHSTVWRVFGRNSILIYVLHFRMTGVLHFVINKVISTSHDLYLYPFYWGIFGLEVFVLYTAAVLFERLKRLER